MLYFLHVFPNHKQVLIIKYFSDNFLTHNIRTPMHQMRYGIFGHFNYHFSKNVGSRSFHNRTPFNWWKIDNWSKDCSVSIAGKDIKLRINLIKIPHNIFGVHLHKTVCSQVQENSQPNLTTKRIANILGHYICELWRHCCSKQDIQHF